MAEGMNREEYLKKQLQDAEEKLILSATYGKQLMEENQEFHEQLKNLSKVQAKCEGLEQEKYSLKLKLDASLKSEVTYQQEIESIKDLYNKKLNQQKIELDKEIEQLNKNHLKKKTDLESTIESLQCEVKINAGVIEDLENQLIDAQNKTFNTSIHSTTINEEITNLQTQLSSIMLEKQKLESQMSKYKADSSMTENKMSALKKKVSGLEEQLEQKECEATSYFNSLEKSKEEAIELQLHIDNLQMAQTDPNKKGNSLFAEVEDHRKYLEDMCVKYKTNYDTISKQMNEKNDLIGTLKIQIASLISLNSTKVDKDYIVSLEDSLESYKQQLASLKTMFKNLEEKKVVNGETKEVTNSSSLSQTSTSEFSNYLQAKCKKLENDLAIKEKSLDKELFNKAILTDQIIALKREFNDEKRVSQQLCSEKMKLEVRIQELMNKLGLKNSAPIKRKKIVEKLECWQTNQKSNAADSEKEVTSENKEDGFTSREMPLEDGNILKECNNKIMSEENESSRKSEPLVIKSTFNDKNTTENISNGRLHNKDVNVDDKENLIKCEISNDINKGEDSNSQNRGNKVKKSVKISETINVKDEDGLMKEAILNKTNDHKKPIRTLKRMVAPPPDDDAIDLESCKQQ